MGTRRNLILRKVSHPSVWFWCSVGSRQLLKFCNNTQKVPISHYDFFRICKVVAHWTEKDKRVKETVGWYWPLKKRSLDFSSSLVHSRPSQETQHRLSSGRLVKVRAAEIETQICSWRCVSDLEEWKGTIPRNGYLRNTTKQKLLHPPASANTPPSP